MTGFLVMATAPMPMFATFGVLTAVMIAFSLLVSLLVLPSLLLLITPSRKGAEREEMIDLVTRGEYEYETGMPWIRLQLQSLKYSSLCPLSTGIIQ